VHRSSRITPFDSGNQLKPIVVIGLSQELDWKIFAYFEKGFDQVVGSGRGEQRRNYLHA
jgi:hypothetical protein